MDSQNKNCCQHVDWRHTIASLGLIQIIAYNSRRRKISEALVPPDLRTSYYDGVFASAATLCLASVRVFAGFSPGIRPGRIQTTFGDAVWKPKNRLQARTQPPRRLVQHTCKPQRPWLRVSQAAHKKFRVMPCLLPHPAPPYRPLPPPDDETKQTLRPRLFPAARHELLSATKCIKSRARTRLPAAFRGTTHSQRFIVTTACPRRPAIRARIACPNS